MSPAASHQINLVSVVDRAAAEQHLTRLVKAETPTEWVIGAAARAEQGHVGLEHASAEIRAITDEAEHACHASLRLRARSALCAVTTKHTAPRRASHVSGSTER